MKSLCLFFTYGISLADWNNNGSIYREISIYKKLLERFDKIYFITYGTDDKKYHDILPDNVVVLFKKINIPNGVYSFLIPIIYHKEISSSQWLKTNQILGSWSAVISKIIFRKKLLIRTGYTQSLFVSKERNQILKKFLIYFIELFGFLTANIVTVTSQNDKNYIVKSCYISYRCCACCCIRSNCKRSSGTYRSNWETYCWRCI